MQLHATRFSLAEQKRNTWFVTLPAGSDYSEVFTPRFWSHVAVKLRPADLIEVMNDEMTFRAVLIVRACDRLSASVVEVAKIEFSGALASEDAQPSTVEVQWRGPHDKHCVVRIASDGKKDVLATGFGTKEEAEAAKLSHMKTFALKAA